MSLTSRGQILSDIQAGKVILITESQMVNLCRDLRRPSPPRYCRANSRPGRMYECALVGVPNPVPGFKRSLP